MAEERVTEYEPSERTVEKIKCSGCDTTWESLDEVDVIVARDASVWKGKSRMYSHNSGTVYSGNNCEIRCTNIEHYCQNCVNSMIGSAVTVEETEKYVSEVKKTVYTCDFCGHDMGEKKFCDISMNPRIEIYEENQPRVDTDPLPDKSPVSVNGVGSKYYCGQREFGKFVNDGEYDSCESCARDIFNMEKPSGLISGFTCVCADIKTAFFGNS